MTCQEFYNKYVGRYVDWDDVSPNQCLDLIKAYIQECHNQNIRGRGKAVWGDAVNYWNLPGVLSKLFFQVPYRKGMIPMPGDIAVWNTGKHGHVALVYDSSCTQSALYTFDQNFGKDKHCRRVKHSYDNVIGFLRPFRTIMWAVNVRSDASMQSRIVGELASGSRVRPLELYNNFVELSQGRWIHYNSLNKL